MFRSALSRAWPITLALLIALALPSVAVADNHEKGDDAPRMTADTFDGLALRGIGPALMSGRIADVVIDQRNPSTWYVAVGSGGVWKTVNNGTTFTPIFDGEAVYSIGCVTIDPNDSNVIWVGTGENVGGRHVSFGDGVYKSLDGGESWTNMGLGETEHIGNIVIDPRDSDVVYVAAQGPLWSKGGERGLYKTTDGGANWAKILGGGPYTGVNEVHLDPRNADVLYAATHERFRNVAALINGGPESGIHKSTDGGETWRELTEGLPDEDMGKIGLAISPQQPDVVYATIELATRRGGFYRSADGGETWEHRNEYLSGGTGPHYYQELFADPHHFDRVYQMDVRLHVTRDGGHNFERVAEEAKHGDNHALAFHPDDPDYLLNGSDGGLYQSWDQGANWLFAANLPVTQFYKVAVDDDEPFYNVYGGTQDNNTQGGPSRTNNVSGIRNSDWFITLFGDGHQPATEPGNPDIVYSEWQQGNLVRYDRTTGEIVYIQPQPAAGDPPERWNWDAPILVSPHAPTRLYFASQRVWRSDNRGDSWTPVSGDLTLDQDRIALPMMGRVQSVDAIWDLWAMSTYNTITSLSESPKVEGLLYAGTDDGLIQVSEDGGANWRRAGALPGVPKGAFINDIKADLHDADVVYVALDHHKFGDFRPFLLRSGDRGRTWTSIAGDADSGGLPADHLVWRVVQDHEKPGLLFAGTEFGVFFTVEGGNRWIELNGGVPTISFRDLAIQRRENDLVGATFGRGFYILDDYTPLRQVSETMLGEPATLFPVKDTDWYVQRTPLGFRVKGTQGAGFYNAPNPPFGAIFTYYLRDDLETARDQRRAREREAIEAGKDATYPGWDALHEENKEETPSIILTVRDAQNRIVRRVEGPTSAGFHRVAWDLRYPAMVAWRAGERDPEREWSFWDPRGPLAVPGTYRVELAMRHGGTTTSLGAPQTFAVEMLYDGALPRTAPSETLAFQQQVETLVRSLSSTGPVVERLETQLAAMHDVLVRSDADPALRDNVRALEVRLYDLRQQLFGDSLRGGIGEPTSPTPFDRLSTIEIGMSNSTYGPTPMYRQVYADAVAAYGAMHASLTALLADADALGETLDAAGVPWSPGRSVPDAP
ncbi:MAG: glycosyl hydrolase [Acidobacteriota bacterium]